MSEKADLTIVIPAWNEEKNLSLLLPLLKAEMEALGVKGEIIVADHEAADGTGDLCRREGAQLLMVSQASVDQVPPSALHTAEPMIVPSPSSRTSPSSVHRRSWLVPVVLSSGTQQPAPRARLAVRIESSTRMTSFMSS